MNKVEQYEHHGESVYVISELKGQHRKNCLCFNGCLKFKPGEPDNCPIAQAVYENCVKYNITTPMYECPKFIRYQKESRSWQAMNGLH